MWETEEVSQSAMRGGRLNIRSSDLVCKGWLAGCAGSAQPLDSATCMRLHIWADGLACLARFAGSSARKALAYSVRLIRLPWCARK